MISAVSLLITSFFFFLKLIIFIVCSQDSQNYFMQSLHMYTSYLFSMLLNDDIVDTRKPDGIRSPLFVVDEFSGLFLFIYITFLLNIQDLCKQ